MVSNVNLIGINVRSVVLSGALSWIPGVGVNAGNNSNRENINMSNIRLDAPSSANFAIPIAKDNAARASLYTYDSWISSDNVVMSGRAALTANDQFNFFTTTMSSLQGLWSITNTSTTFWECYNIGYRWTFGGVNSASTGVTVISGTFWPTALTQSSVVLLICSALVSGTEAWSIDSAGVLIISNCVADDSWESDFVTSATGYILNTTCKPDALSTSDGTGRVDRTLHSDRSWDVEQTLFVYTIVPPYVNPNLVTMALQPYQDVAGGPAGVATMLTMQNWASLGQITATATLATKAFLTIVMASLAVNINPSNFSSTAEYRARVLSSIGLGTGSKMQHL